MSLDKNTNYLLRIVLTCLGFAALVWLFETGTPVFLPLACALVAGVVFAPLADFLDNLGAPRVAGAMVVLLLILSAVVLTILVFYPIVSSFFVRVPYLWNELQSSFSGLKETMENVENVQDKVSETLNSDGDAATEKKAVEVPGFADILAYLPSIAAQIMVFVGLLYFFLLTRTDIYEFIARKSSTVDMKVLCRAEAEVSRYFLTVTAINGVFGVLVTLMLMLLDMPNAIYWGIGAFLANFILYLGPISFAGALLVAGLVTFDGAMSFAPPLLFLAMNMIEGQFVTPSLVGRNMKVNPLLVFLSLVFWMWMWGPLGGIIAIPILVWMRQINKAIHVAEEPEPASARRFIQSTSTQVTS